MVSKTSTFNLLAGIVIGQLTLLLLVNGVSIPRSGDPNYPQSLTFLGVVDGKGYFVDANQTKTWNRAKAYCAEWGLELASIQTKNESDFLIKSLDTYGCYNNFWTSAQETRRPSMLEWKTGAESEIDMEAVPNWIMFGFDFQYCASLVLRQASWNSNRIDMDVSSCLAERNILCQL